MNEGSFTYALQWGLITALSTAALVGAMVYFLPEEWRLLGAIISGAAAIAFWVGFVVRLTGADTLSEFGLNYPDLQRKPSIHKELGAMREEIEELRRKLS